MVTIIYGGNSIAQLHYNWGGASGNPVDDWVKPEWPYNHYVNIKQFNLLYNTPIYYSFVINPQKNLQQIFVNGEKKLEGYMNDVPYAQFWNDVNQSNDELEICIGTCEMASGVWWHFPEMECYGMRLYNRPLNDTEIAKNYNTTVSYHQFLENSGNASTSGDTGGVSF